jgi:hypothetical protein
VSYKQLTKKRKQQGSCYYLINFEDTADPDETAIGLIIKAAKGTKVFVYEGSRRFPVNLEVGGGPAIVNKLYKGSKSSPLVLISQQNSPHSSLTFKFKAKSLISPWYEIPPEYQ